MSKPRAAAGLIVSALIRRVEAEGGSVMVIARGDATAGAMLLQLADRGNAGAMLERVPGLHGAEWIEVGPQDRSAQADYVARRRRADPDLWVVEVDHPQARTLAIEIAG